MRILKKQCRLMALAVVLTLLQTVWASPQPDFVCENGTAIYYYYKDAQKISFDGYPLTNEGWLPKTATAINGGVRFSKQETHVYVGPQGASILTSDYRVIQCQTPIVDPHAQGLSVAGLSLGSVMRTGPGADFPKITTLPIGSVVTLKDVTKKTLNGFSWFQVSYGADRKMGYIWGGTICFDGGRTGSVYPCPLGILP